MCSHRQLGKLREAFTISIQSVLSTSITAPDRRVCGADAGHAGHQLWLPGYRALHARSAPLLKGSTVGWMCASAHVQAAIPKLAIKWLRSTGFPLMA